MRHMGEKQVHGNIAGDAESGDADTKNQVAGPAVLLHLRQPAYAIVLS